MDAPVIRPAGLGDVATALALWQRADAVPSVTDDADSVAAVAAGGSLLLAEIDGAVVGTLIAAWDGWRGNMYRLAVDPDHRRLGIARALVQEGERRLAAAGCRRVTALVVGAEDQATAFWHAAGYPIDPRIHRHVKTLSR